LRGLVNVFKANSHYAPQQLTTTPITLFKAKEKRGEVSKIDSSWGWSQFDEKTACKYLVTNFWVFWSPRFILEERDSSKINLGLLLYLKIHDSVLTNPRNATKRSA
jgi:hypothetical protein